MFRNRPDASPAEHSRLPESATAHLGRTPRELTAEIVATYKGVGAISNGNSDPFGDGTLTVLFSGPHFGF
jgi:hypothetical protein